MSSVAAANGSSAAPAVEKKEVAVSIPQGDGEVSALESDPEYLKYLKALHAKWVDCPSVTINYNHLSYNINIPKASHDIVTVPRALFNVAIAIPRLLQSFFLSSATKREKVHRFAALHKSGGCIVPGSMTLVLAPPGHGKTTFLKALSGRLYGDKNFTGSLMYNGMSAVECRDRGINVTRLCAYVGQQDFTFPTLTVKETLDFAAKNSVPDINLLADNPESAEDKTVVDFDERRAELLINLLGMKECKDTIVGNDLLRGISGGQKKRVALAEMILTNARVFCLDEVSTGLDAAVTKYIFQQFKEAIKITKASIVTALLQPTPETYELFDDVVLLREGVVVYHGPRKEVGQWLRECLGMPKPHGVDEAQWILDVLTDPISAHYSMIEMQKAAALSGSTSLQSRQISAVSPLLRPKSGDEDEKRSADLLARANGVIVSPVLQPITIINPSRSLTQPAERLSEPLPREVVFHMNGTDMTVEHDSDDKDTTSEQSSAVDRLTNLKGLPPAVEVEMQHLNQKGGFIPIPKKIRSESDSLLHQSGHSGHHSGHEGDESSNAAGLLNEKSGGNNECADFMHAYLKSIGSGEFVTPAVDTDTMHYNFKHSQWYVRQLLKGARQMNDSDELDPSHWGKYTSVMFGSKYPHSMWEHTKMCLSRQFKIIARNRTMVRPRVIQSILMGFIFGTLFFQLSANDYRDKMGLLLYCVMFTAFANLTELPVAGEAKNVVGKQLDAGFFPTISYTISVIIMHLPVCVVEIIIFGTMIYFIPGFTSDAGRFFFFLLVLLCASSAMSVFFRSISYIAKNPDVARQMDIPFIVIFLIFGGFLLPYSSVPHWLIWLYWISPFSWAVRSLALNEFKAPRFDGVGTGERPGDVFLDAFDIFTDDIWKWMGVVYLVGFFLLSALFSMYVLSGVKPVTPLGTRRQATHHKRLKNPKNDHLKFSEDGHIIPDDEPPTDREHQKKRDSPIPEANEEKEEAEREADEAAAVEAGIMSPAGSDDIEMKEIEGAQKKMKKISGANGKKKTNQSAMPFTPVTIAWKDLNYTVFVGKDQHPKQLLYSVNGFALPGEMTALMGASGAGKTTLMDVIAARKTTGKIEGDILVNGVKVSNEDFQHLMGYVEQNDIHLGTQTVREALEFSAELRLPASVTAEQRKAFITEVMELVGLTSIADRLVGDAALPGIAPGQLKLVTIAVELVANPSILFLDEPTSGLDAPAALRVMKAIRNIAGTGRTVVCTIHQPSAQLFYMFDRLLLLRSGGRTVYFSKIGKKGRKLVDYFQGLDSRVPHCPRHINPANWMLDVIGAAGNAIVEFDFADRWDKSALAGEAQKELDLALAKADSSADGLKVSQLAYPNWVQRFKAVLVRSYVSHWRNPPMNATRIILMIVVGLLLGVIYENMSTSDFSGVQSKLSVLFLGISFPASVCAGAASPTLFRQRAVYYRETTSKMYDFHHYAHSLMLVELPWIAAALICFLLPYYFMIGFATDAGLFFRFCLVVYMMSICYSFLSQLWLALMPNVIVANVVNGLFMSLFFMFGGLFIQANSMPTAWKWFYYIDPVPKALIAAATTQFYCGGADCQVITVPGTGITQTVSDYIADVADGNHTEYWTWLGWMLLEIVALRLFTLFCLKFISHIKR